MKSIGVREFRDKASHYIASSEILAIKKHEKLVGFYIPIQESNQNQVEEAFKQLSETVAMALAESGLSEESLSKALDLSKKEEE